MKSENLTNRRAFTLIELLLVITVIAILAGIGMPAMFAARKRGKEASAISSLRQIARAEETFRARQTPPVFTTLDKLGQTGLLDPVVAAGHKSGYTFSQPVAPASETYVVIATPDPNAGDRHFYLDQSGVIRAAQNGPADEDGTPID